MSERRRRKRPSPWRCLWWLQFAVYATVALLLLDPLDGLVCELMPPLDPDGACATLGSAPSWLAIGVMVLSVMACALQGLRDFYKRQDRAQRS
jgi:hypothetical protein